MRRLLSAVFIVSVLGASLPAAAAGLKLRLDSLQAYGINVQSVEVDFLPEAEDGESLRLRAAQLEWPEAGLSVKALAAACPLQADAGGWRCAGQASVGTTPAPLQAGFVANLEQGRLRLELERAPAHLQLAQGGKEQRWQLQLRQLPLAWLEGYLHQAWPELSRIDGQLALDAELPAASTAPFRVDYSLRGAGFDTTAGTYAAAEVGLAGKLDLRSSAKGWSLIHDGQLSGGEVLLGSFHAKLADHGTRLGFRLAPDGDAYRLDQLAYADPAVLELKGSARIAPARSPALQDLSLDSIDLRLPAAQQRYLQGLLGAAGWAELASSGRLHGRARFDAAGIAGAALHLEDVALAETGRGVEVKGLAGQLEWAREGEAPGGQLGWQSAALYSLPLGAASSRWNSRDGVLALAAPARIPLLGGALDVLNLQLHPAAASSERLQAGLAVHDVELAALSKALGWPRFGGKLGGAVPQLRYADQRLDLAGGLMLNVFDGTLNVTGLALERPFGVMPSLSADIAFSGLDLALVTGTFDIGEISGRLSGQVRELRLVDWAPVAFDAEFKALDGGRISQRAVKTISSVGGGGIAAGLQASVLRLFDTFGYARLGIGCRLRNAVCQMRGLDNDGARYTLVEGRGLPRIQIVGHQSEVDWAVLVDRLKAAASGTAPVIN